MGLTISKPTPQELCQDLPKTARTIDYLEQLANEPQQIKVYCCEEFTSNFT